MRCYICGAVKDILYPIAWGKLEITAYVCKPCMQSIESQHKEKVKK